MEYVFKCTDIYQVIGLQNPDVYKLVHVPLEDSKQDFAKRRKIKDL